MRGKVSQRLIRTLHSGITPAYAGKRPTLLLFRRSTVGSPPPMRGKVPHSFVHHLSTRITPAYAGKSVTVFRSAFSSRDHPRLCGEKLPGGRTTSKNMGSPPPMRGKGLVYRSAVIVIGITPAYAGKSVRPPGKLEV